MEAIPMKQYNLRQSVELFHLLFLNQLGRKIDKKLYALKGGCNMRFYFKSIRYSEDMDIDIHIINKDTLFKNVNKLLNSAPFNHILQAQGIEILNTSSPKQTPTTQRWKIVLKSKQTALALRSETQSRDIFDLYFLINSGNHFELDENTSVLLEDAKSKAYGIAFEDFKGQVVAYLPEDQQHEYDDASVWDAIVETVVTSISECKNEIT